MAITRSSRLTRFSKEQLESRILLAADPIKINFQPDGMIDAEDHPELLGYVADDGDAFGSRGNGLTYGWLDSDLNPDDQRQTRNRNNGDAQDERYDTLNHMIKGDNHSWQIELQNGSYDIRIVAGDPSHTDQVADLELISGENIVQVDDPDGQDNWDELIVNEFEVTNGLLRFSPRESGQNQKLAFVEITPLDEVEPELPVLNTLPATNVSPFGAQLNGEVTFDGNSDTVVRFYYGDNDAGANLSWDHSLNLNIQSGMFNAAVEDLLPDTQYFYRVFGLNFAGPAWSPATEAFTTQSLDPPVAENGDVTHVTANSATLNGNATGVIIPDVAVYWGESDGGTDAVAWQNTFEVGASAGSFSVDLNDLKDGTTYYFRTFASNLGGSSWASSSTSFRTPTITPPVLANQPIIDVEAFEAVIGGQVLETGNETPEVLLYWGDNDGGLNPAAWDNSIAVGPHDGFFSTTINGLADGQSYYYRASATNSSGTEWSPSTESFVTLTVTPPVLVNDLATRVTSSSAQLGGTVTDFGNDAPHVSIFYGTSNAGSDRNAWENVVELSPEFGTFSQTVVGLLPETTYFYRVYGSNTAGNSWASTTAEFTTLEAPTLLITEFLASNSDSISTRIRTEPGGAYGQTMNPDWVEIHNPGAVAIDLGGLFLSDDGGNRNKWQFPAGTQIAANGYLVVFASGEDVTDPLLDQRGYLHTSFKLSTGGEFLAITDSNGGVIHGFDSFPNQRADISYGVDDSLNEHFYSEPTPGTANSDSTINLVADTTFSHDRGFYDTPFELEITTKTPGATIVFTTDGTLPTPTNGTRVEPTNESVAPTASLNISTTTLVRAFAFREGFDATNVDTQSYLFLDDVLTQATNPETGQQVTPAGFPSSWGGVTGDYQVDPDIVNHARESDRLKVGDLKSVPTISIVMDNDDLFGANQIYLTGSGSPRAMSIEMITPDGSQEFQQDASIQVQGGSSTNRWKDYKLSLRVKFQAPFGPPKLNHALYEDSTIDRYDNITLDGVLNHAWVHSGQHVMPQYIQDQYVADLHNAMDGFSPNGRFVHLYLNGLYWGMYYMHDRPDHAWAAEKFGGNKDTYHAVKHSGSNVINNGNGNSARDSYNDMVAAARDVQRDPTDLAKWQALTERLDVDNFITYSLANWFTGNHDWPAKNWYATAPDGGPWRFHSWDAEHATDSDNDVGESPSNLHNALDGNAEYAMRMADVIHEHFFNDGVLTVESTSAKWQARMDEIDRAIVGESARWGDNRSRRAHTREEWLRYNGENGGLLEDYFPGRSSRVLGQLRSAGIYPNLDAPEFNQHGGNISSGFELSIANPDNRGTIYFTTDGSDPRLVGGTRNPTSSVFSENVSVTDTSTIKARILDGTTWSALAEADFIVSAARPDDLVISEINYNPHATMTQFGESNVDADEFEFIEVQNVSDHTVDLSGVNFARTSVGGNVNGIEYSFPSQTLAAGERVVVVANREAFRSRYGTDNSLAPGEFSGQLSNAGEQLTLLSFDGQIIQQFRFDNSGSWPGRSDGRGSTLEFKGVGDPASGNSWQSSSDFGGSPGTVGSGRLDDVVINEVLTHTDLPQIDFIELHNATGEQIDVSNWFVSDSGADYFRYQIPVGTSITPGGYAVFNEEQLGFGFRGQQSDDAWLIEADASGRPLRFMDHVRFGAAANGVSLGRWPNGSGNMFPMTSPSAGSQNVGPILSDIIVSELNYHPAEPPAGSVLTRDELEFVEIWNVGSSAVGIGDWRFDDAIEFDFAAGTVLQSNTGAVVVSFDPDDELKSAAFKLAYDLPQNSLILGPFAGKLDNGGETLEFERPEDVGQVGSGYVLVDRVAYDDMAPWPNAADGTGDSLNRAATDSFGAFASSWVAAEPTPNSVNFAPTPTADLNGDGVVDANDIDVMCAALPTDNLQLDVNGDGKLDFADYEFFIFNVLHTTIGDANVDGAFDSGDLVQVFQANEYEDAIVGNSTWAEGDWNCDGEFDSGDLVSAFQTGGYTAAARVADRTTTSAVAAAMRIQSNGTLIRRADSAAEESAAQIETRKEILDDSTIDLIFARERDWKAINDRTTSESTL